MHMVLGETYQMVCVQQTQSEEMHSQRVGVIGTIKLAERLAASSSTGEV